MKRVNFLSLLSIFALSVYVLNINNPFVADTVKTLEASDEAVKAKDVVCGMIIDKEGAKVVDISGKKFYFCSEKCKAKFSEDPTKVTCMCFVGLEEGDEPCGCPHCSGKGGKCKCGEEHGHHHGHEHEEHGH